jgi:recombinational DNA repair protein (RecF pathway)
MSSSRSYGKSLGFVLRKYPWHDDGVLLVVYSRDYGKINLLHKSMMKREIFGGWTDTFSLVEFSFLQNMKKEYQLLLTADSIEKYPALYSFPHLLIYLSVLLEIVEYAFPLHEPDCSIFEMIEMFLKYNITFEENSMQAQTLVILLNLMSQLGWSPLFHLSGDTKVKSLIKKIYASKVIDPEGLKEVSLLATLIYVLDVFEYLLERPLKSASYLKEMTL